MELANQLSDRLNQILPRRRLKLAGIYNKKDSCSAKPESQQSKARLLFGTTST